MKVLVTIAYITFVLPLFAQEEEPGTNSIFIESGGPATYGSTTYGSINYEHKLNETRKHFFSGRIGFGIISFKDHSGKFNPDFSVPFGITSGYYLLKKNSWSISIDGGAGLLFTSMMGVGKLFEPTRYNHLNLYLHSGFGINFPRRIMVRLAYTPILTHNAEWVNWGGISIGYRFKQ